MPRIAYTPEQMREAVALARIVGAETAAAELGMDPRTVRGWMSKAGAPPELEGTPAQWQSVSDLAQARLANLVAKGRLSAVQLATIAGIADRNLRAAGDRKPPEPATPAQELDDWITATYPTPRLRELARDAVADAIRWQLHLFDVGPGRALDEDRTEPDEATGAAVNEWAKAVLAEIPDLEAWSVQEAERRRLAFERNRLIGARSDVLVASGMRWDEARRMATEITTDLPDPYLEALYVPLETA